MEVKVEAVNAKLAKFNARIKAAEGTANKAGNGLASSKGKTT